ncbi:hypothetical protein [Microvirga sp. VF16]|uniref:hypothetical protein n=1 Tax=Microvirga sp. VF16 TaxID=2807101 RepID=UPI00193E20C5|nr:hypothetical protein [Microvirga sp. VF16]QRM34665.1 hypothetical protein JO965_40985 [Microvirga sp. VF16]
MKLLVLAAIAAISVAGAAHAETARATRGPSTVEPSFPAGLRSGLERDLTSRFPEGSFPPGYRPTPLQEMLARNGAAAFDNSRYLVIKRNSK